MTELSWEQLHTQSQYHTALFEQIGEIDDLLALQPRLSASFSLFCKQQSLPAPAPIILVKAKESYRYLSLFAQYFEQHLPKQDRVQGSRCDVHQRTVTVSPAQSTQDNFAAKHRCLFADWIEHEQLFGAIRQTDDGFHITPGLIHQINGGVLVLSLQTLLSQPLLWLRLKNILFTQQHQWCSAEDNKTLPLTIPTIPVSLRLVLVGDRASIADFEEFEPSLIQQSLYAEFESEYAIDTPAALSQWLAYVNRLGADSQLLPFELAAYPELLRHATRTCQDQYHVPLCLDWLTQLLSQFTAAASHQYIDQATIQTALQNRLWREGYLPERALEDIHQAQIRIQTDGDCIGQVNGLAVVEYPGHPQDFGEPTRISCVLQSGSGELNDVEHRVELGGNLHAKGMMIMQAYVCHTLALDQQLPFSASLVFEQSYSEVDGDSASLAGLCAYLSALAGQPILQQFAVTGSVDQFGQVQPIGGINEKIEGFFAICQQRILTGKQGVLFPKANLRHLCLQQQVVDAVKAGLFHLYPIENVEQAMEILTEIPYQGEDNQLYLLDMIQLRIQRALSIEKRKSPKWLRWLLG